ncbi:glycosyltransferase [Halomonas binhaiensis]|uniref:Glycosyltransferase n=1 Tax=Halomonas binhaiensis TaxID=2562282 RepID=A0A5C1NCC3_9GAMM|nr:glycosyltransferase [Halomonas binhaiensis]QEM80118.1 glycosyltransferase [Halomonas binhaiensis]
MSKAGKLLGIWKRREHENQKNTICEDSRLKASDSIVLDLEYYRKTYPDLAKLNDKQLEQHWYRHGFVEKRFASESHALQCIQEARKLSEKAIVPAENMGDELINEMQEHVHGSEVDLDFYLTLYPDIYENGVRTEEAARAHYIFHGKEEERYPSLREWAARNLLPYEILSHDFSLKEIIDRSSSYGIEIEPGEILDSLLGTNVSAIPLGPTPEDTHSDYLRLGQHFLGIQKRQEGRALLEASLLFFQSSKALELLGNSYLDEGHHGIALTYYNAALDLPNPPKWLFFNRANCLLALQQNTAALLSLSEGIAANPTFRQQYDKLDEVAELCWQSIQASLMGWVDANERGRLLDSARQFATTLYRAYLPMFGGPFPGRNLRGIGNPELIELPPLGNINTDNILIVGDFHVAQCERYRINQKIEQLESVGKRATAIDWMELEKYSNALALHDIVIFYRVPAVPKVIKAIAQVNSVGKLGLYEIDDLIFDPIYPPAIETYGGYVALETYRGLTRGMALFNAAACLCRGGIVSTEPLRKHLSKLVREHTCLVHRNGFDHLNQFRPQTERQKATIDIFYGSGTQAHNSDFIDLALPAIERILEQNLAARLVVVGYLRLPKAFHTRFSDQFKQLPPVKSVQSYWSLLEQADINIAVLHDDEINACKSELKWFEAACFAIPSVVSDTANYRDVIRHGEDAYIAATTSDWYTALNELVEHPEKRRAIGQTAMQRVKEEYSLETLGSHLVSQLEASFMRDNAPLSVVSQARAKKKIALVNVFFPPQSIGGATRVLADNFKAFRKHYSADLDICVFTADAECRAPHEMMVYDYEGTRVYRTTTLWREHMDWHPKDPEMYRLFREFLDLEKPDLIHFHCVQRLTSSVVEAARDHGVPYMVTAHDAWWISDFQFLVDHNGKVYPEGHPDPYQSLELPPNIDLAASIERRRDLKSLLDSAQEVLTVSEAFADIYRKNGIHNIRVIRNGISDDVPWAPKDTSYTDRVVGGHIGGMSEHKGYQLLQQTIMTVQPDNMEFLIVDHSKEEGYESIEYWGKVPVTFIGRVSQEKIVDLYRRIDVLFAPSTWPESYGLVTREAAACGCWVVASDMGGIGEDVQEGVNGHVIEPNQLALEGVLRKIDSSITTYKSPSESRDISFAKDQTDALASEYLS